MLKRLSSMSGIGHTRVAKTPTTNLVRALLAILSIGCASEEPLSPDARGDLHGTLTPVDDATNGQDANGLDTTGSPLCSPSAELCAAYDPDERPERLSEHSAVYDNARAQMLVYGGTHSVPINCQVNGTANFSAEVWLYDDACNRWARLDDADFARSRHSAAIGNDGMWIFGGRFRAGDSGDYTLYNDLHRFDLDAQRWEQVTVNGPDNPAARITATMTWDSKRDKLWLFGGNVAASGLRYEPLNDLWSFDVEQREWTEQLAEQRPPARLFHSMLYDASRDWLVIFAGGNETAFDNVPEYFSDVWAFDIEAGEWLLLASQHAGPSGRFWSSLVHDTSTDRYLVFGGHDPGTLLTGDNTLGNLNDVWRFDPDGGWENLLVGDTFNAGSRGFCDFPPDFALIDDHLPERRSAHSLVWSEACQHALLFAGKTDCGSADDVWRFADSRWVKRQAAREGEVCYRWRDEIDQCSDICF